ncbi:uncharacterized protein Tco025E_10242, partial [Trypanosoma conorhini]
SPQHGRHARRGGGPAASSLELRPAWGPHWGRCVEDARALDGGTRLPTAARPRPWAALRDPTASLVEIAPAGLQTASPGDPLPSHYHWVVATQAVKRCGERSSPWQFPTLPRDRAGGRAPLRSHFPEPSARRGSPRPQEKALLGRGTGGGLAASARVLRAWAFAEKGLSPHASAASRQRRKKKSRGEWQDATSTPPRAVTRRWAAPRAFPRFTRHER